MNEDITAMAGLTGLLLTAAQRKKRLEETGLTPIFNQQTPKVEKFDLARVDETFLKFVEDVNFFANNNPYLRLAGLAANQLQKDGKRLDVRLCFILIDNHLHAAVNPVIKEKFGPTYRSKEGCLTWPNQKIVAIRHTGVEVDFIDITGGLTPVNRRVEGAEAIIWQHEVDHLDGVTEEFVVKLAKKDTPGPNDPCICGKKDANGKIQKFKKCCGR